MNIFISLFLPSLVGYKLLLNINKKKRFNIESKIFYYLMFLLFSNSISIIIAKLLFGLNSNLESNLYLYPIFAVKYIITCLIINIILAFLFSFIKEVTIDIEIKKIKKTNRKKGRKNEKNIK